MRIIKSLKGDMMQKLSEHNIWAIITIAVCSSIIIAAFIISNSGRYVSIPSDNRRIQILDTKKGDVYIDTNGIQKGKRVWIRKRIRGSVYRAN